MAINLPFCFSIQFLEQLLKFLVNFTLLKYVKSQRSYGFLITKELIFGFQILDFKDHFSASLKAAFDRLHRLQTIRPFRENNDPVYSHSWSVAEARVFVRKCRTFNFYFQIRIVKVARKLKS